MKAMTWKDGVRWTEANCGVDLNSLRLDNLPEYQHYCAYVTPLEAGKLKFLATYGARLFDGGNDLVLWIYDCEHWSWQENESFPLFDAYRQLHGETESVLETPFHIIYPEDENVLESLLSAALLYEWQVMIFDLKLEQLLNFTDGVYTFYSKKAKCCPMHGMHSDAYKIKE